MDLKKLYDQLLAAGCNRFYIDGVGGPQSDDVDCLGCFNGVWEVYYSERGQKGTVLFSTSDKEEAIEYYYHYVLKIEHWHLVTFTKSANMMQHRKQQLDIVGIRTIENNIPNYRKTGDHVYRLFVTNKDIYKAKEILGIIPYIDEGLSNAPGAAN